MTAHRAEQLRAELAARRTALLMEAASRPDGLPAFARLLWPVIEPKRPLVWSWHLDALCSHLMASYNGALPTDELVCDIPPRHSKSSFFGVLGPAWWWLRNPEAQYLCLTKAEKNAARDARLMRRVVSSPIYEQLKARIGATWKLSADQNRVDYYANDAGGHRISLTTSSGMTGAGADYLIIDDPHDVDDTLGSPEQVVTEMSRVWSRYEEVWTSRLNPSERGGQVQVIQQRLHELDLAGHLLKRGATGLVLPMMYEADHEHAWRDDPRQEGEVLCPGRFGPAELAKAQANPMKWAGQYQQRPAPREGGLFKAAWFKQRYSSSNTPAVAGLLLSIDATFKDTRGSDFAVIQTWGRLRAAVGAVLLEQTRERMDYPTLRASVLSSLHAARAAHPGLPVLVLIEDKANGSALIADLRREVPGVIPFNPGSKSKYERAQVGAVPWFQARQVHLPENHEAAWVRGYIAEHLSFPNSAHDDQVDATSQALIYMAQHPLTSGGVRHGGSRRNLDERSGRSSNRGSRRRGW
jgi:predicted phage terminase large subunit-like protein